MGWLFKIVLYTSIKI